MNRKFKNLTLINKDKLYKLAYIDPITNLGNYNAYLERVKEKLEINSKKTMIILDIDKFKSFNKEYGHTKGNELLKRVGEEIKHLIRKTDIVCRLANDVFGIFLVGEVDVNNITERLNKNISRIYIGDRWYNIRISIGIYICSKEEKNIQSMIDKAIMAHDSIKGKYNVTYGVFTEEFEQKMVKENEIESMMIEGIENQEFEIYYQPQISTKTEQIKGAEALVRWNKDGKIISPGEFIPVFEKNHFIIKLDQYIYEKVCIDIQEMKEIFKEIPKISINISKESLFEKDFLEKYIKITNKYNVKPNDIELEITERTTVNDDKYMKGILEQVKEKGFGIAIDDFGTGYSSLIMLEVMPIDTLKIDKSFIDRIGINNKEVNLIEIIMLITKKLKLKTVAEGVEKSKQVEYLKKINCDLIQGYFYSKPLDFEAFKNYIKENKNKI